MEGACPILKDSDLFEKNVLISRLMDYLRRARVLLPMLLPGFWRQIGALLALVPFLYIWMILRDILAAAPDYAQAVKIPSYGWMAVLYAHHIYLVYVWNFPAVLSHLAALSGCHQSAITAPLRSIWPGCPRTLRRKLRQRQAARGHSEHRRSEVASCHQLPDQYSAMATPVGLLVLLFVFDWRLGL